MVKLIGTQRTSTVVIYIFFKFGFSMSNFLVEILSSWKTTFRVRTRKASAETHAQVNCQIFFLQYNVIEIMEIFPLGFVFFINLIGKSSLSKVFANVCHLHTTTYKIHVIYLSITCELLDFTYYKQLIQVQIIIFVNQRLQKVSKYMEMA